MHKFNLDSGNGTKTYFDQVYQFDMQTHTSDINLITYNSNE